MWLAPLRHWLRHRRLRAAFIVRRVSIDRLSELVSKEVTDEREREDINSVAREASHRRVLARVEKEMER